MTLFHNVLCFTLCIMDSEIVEYFTTEYLIPVIRKAVCKVYVKMIVTIVQVMIFELREADIKTRK